MNCVLKMQNAKRFIQVVLKIKHVDVNQDLLILRVGVSWATICLAPHKEVPKLAVMPSTASMESANASSRISRPTHPAGVTKLAFLVSMDHVMRTQVASLKQSAIYKGVVNVELDMLKGRTDSVTWNTEIRAPTLRRIKSTILIQLRIHLSNSSPSVTNKPLWPA
jgi:hypothetical protein